MNPNLFLQNLKILCEQARQSSVSVLVPNSGFLTPPGGQLLHKLYGHFAVVNDITMSVDGKILVTGTLFFQKTVQS